MKLSSLQALVAAIDEGSLRSAARRLGLTQPALTKQIRELERELATTLLVRSTGGVMATAQGVVLYERAVAAEREIAHAVEQIRQLDGHVTGSLSIGAVPLAVLLLIPQTLRTFGAAYPDIQLHIHEDLYIARLTRLRKGEVDIAIGPLPQPLPTGEFVAEPLMPISMVVVARRGHPLVGAKSLTELAQARWVYTGSSSDAGYAKLLYERHGLTPPPAGALVNSTLGLLAVLTSGNCIGLLPRQIAMNPFAAQHLKIVPVAEGPLELSLAVIARADMSLKPAVRHFMAHLHRAAHQLSKR